MSQNLSSENEFYVHENKNSCSEFNGKALSLTLKRKRLVARKLACVAGGILVSWALSWRRSRHAKRVVKPRGNFKSTCIPTLPSAPLPKQYSTPPKCRQLRGLLGNGLFSCNKCHFDKKGFALSLFMNVRVFGTQKWPIQALILLSLVTDLSKRREEEGYT